MSHLYFFLMTITFLGLLANLNSSKVSLAVPYSFCRKILTFYFFGREVCFVITYKLVQTENKPAKLTLTSNNCDRTELRLLVPGKHLAILTILVTIQDNL